MLDFIVVFVVSRHLLVIVVFVVMVSFGLDFDRHGDGEGVWIVDARVNLDCREIDERARLIVEFIVEYQSAGVVVSVTHNGLFKSIVTIWKDDEGCFRSGHIK